MALRVEGVLNIRALERSIGEIARRHENLRTAVRKRQMADAFWRLILQ